MIRNIGHVVMRVTRLVQLIICLMAVLICIGCERQERSSTTEKQKNTGPSNSIVTRPATSPETSIREGFPLWTDEEFDRGKRLTKDMLQYDPRLLLKEIKINTRPPFYKGELPLTYQVQQTGSYGSYVTFFMDFGAWKNHFIYLELDKKSYALANGARAFESDDDHMVASAKLLEVNAGSMKPYLVEERHYDEKGRLIFKCKSHFSKETGFKQDEIDPEGKKMQDYFLLWPDGNR